MAPAPVGDPSASAVALVTAALPLTPLTRVVPKLLDTAMLVSFFLLLLLLLLLPLLPTAITFMLLALPVLSLLSVLLLVVLLVVAVVLAVPRVMSGPSELRHSGGTSVTTRPAVAQQYDLMTLQLCHTAVQQEGQARGGA